MTFWGYNGENELFWKNHNSIKIKFIYSEKYIFLTQKQLFPLLYLCIQAYMYIYIDKTYEWKNKYMIADVKKYRKMIV